MKLCSCHRVFPSLSFFLQSHVTQEGRSRLLVAMKDEGRGKSFTAGLNCSSDTLDFFRGKYWGEIRMMTLAHLLSL